MIYKTIMLMIFLISTNLYSGQNPKTNNELLKIISRTGAKIRYFFFMEKGKSFLIKHQGRLVYSIWYYTDNRKWKPIHNAEAFDGFNKALKNISDISKNTINRTISFSSIINDTIANDTLELLKIIENKTIKTKWYFWTKDKEYFLFKEIKNNEFSIWNYTNEKKWKPIHNTEAFDGFNEALKNLKDIRFDDGYLVIGGIIFRDSDGNLLIYNKDAFIIKINTSISFKRSYKILTDPKYKYNYSVDCNNDGINEVENLKNNYTCEYDHSGIYEVAINGIYPSKGIDTKDRYQNKEILEIMQWGNIKWKSMERAFSGASNMTISAKDIPNLSETNSTAKMFYYAKKFNGDISKWDVSNVRNMSRMFISSSFNGDISKWDVSNVVDMLLMFHLNPFNQDISKWDVSNVKKMSGMFFQSFFNQDISKWDVSNVTDMDKMFHTSPFNQDISKWDVSSATDMHKMFSDSPFNQDISSWKLHPNVNISDMFEGATAMEEKNKPKK